MKNSVFPLVLLVLTAAFSFWLVRGGAARGQDGPDNQQGIFRLAERESRRVHPAEVPGTATVTGSVPALGDGLVVQIVGDDRNGLTRSVCRSLAELMTERGLIAVLEPRSLPGKESEPVPLPCDGSLRIGTDLTQAPAAPGLHLKAVITITAHAVRLPAGHPALRLLPTDVQAAPAPATLTVTLDLGAVAEAEWPTWWSGVGRKAAVAIADAIHLPTTGDPALRIRRGAWLPAAQAEGPGATRPMTEHGPLPSPPQHDVATALVPFSEPLVRGWVGRLTTAPITKHQGGTRTPREELEHRLTRGEWIAGPAQGDRHVFARETNGLTTSISIDADGTLVIWQERPSPATIIQAWLTVPNDPLAKAQLARHRGIAGIPAGLIP